MSYEDSRYIFFSYFIIPFNQADIHRNQGKNNILGYFIDIDFVLKPSNTDLNIGHGVKLDGTQEKIGTSHGDVRVHLPVAMAVVRIGVHKREETVHHLAEIALNGHHRLGTIHQKIEVEQVTTKMGIISAI